MKIVFVTDLPSISARKQNRVLSYTEARELKICADMGGVPEMFELISVLPAKTPFNKSEEIFSYERKVAVKYNYLNGRQEDCFVNPAIQPYVEEFHKRIAAYPKSTVFIPLKSLAFYLLANEVKFTAHIGSIEWTRFGTAVIPAVHPEMLFRSPERRLYTARAIQRAYELLTEKIEKPKTRFIIRPTFSEVHAMIERMLDEDKDVASDIETVSRHISCISICNNHEESMSIPFISHEGSNYIHCYTYEQEVKIIQRMRQLLTRNRIVWQNGSYDIQHITRSWGFVPRNDFDTMLMYHAIYPGLKKDLATLSSLYVPYYQYWKDEHKDFTTLPEDLNSYWTYNAKDSFYTLVNKEKLQVEIEKHGVTEQWQLLQQSEKHLNRISLRGVRIDKKEKSTLMDKLLPELQERQNRINVMAGYNLNTSSPKQMQTFFYEEQGCKVQKNKKTFQPSCDDQALEAIAVEDPLYRPLVNLIQSSRSIGVFLSTFVQMPLDFDGRMRCSYNVGGPETYRLSSSKNPFGSGGNLQNIPKGQEEEEGDDFKLPNLRRMFIPDEGMLLFDADLAGADAQVVAWEANDEDLKAKFRSGEKIHALNAKDMYGTAAGPDGKKAPYYKNAKMGTHLSNYGGTPRTLSKSCAMLIHEAELFQRRWFELHPGIKDWQNRVMSNLQSTGIIENRFGFRRIFYDRPDSVYTNALAWIPQSTIAIIIHKAMDAIIRNLRRVELLLQVHDSLVGQFPIAYKDLYLPKIAENMLVPVPYEDPLIISTSLDISLKSWGDLESWR